MAWILRELSGAGQIITPSQSDFENREIGPLLETYFRGKPGVTARDKTKLFRLAWELASDKFGSRATIHEYYHSADPVRNMANRHVVANKDLYRGMLARISAEMDGQ